MKHARLALVLGLGCVATAALGCEAERVPMHRISATDLAIREATQANADADPQAAQHLRAARERMQKARDCMAARDDQRAIRLLTMAEWDAHLATSLAHDSAAQQDAQQAMAQVQALKQSMP